MKRKMRNLVVIFWLFVLSAIGIVSSTAQPQADKERREAERTWEQMVEIKGGRERLHAITNTLLTSGYKPNDMGVKLNVYPSKTWFWRTGLPVPKFAVVDVENSDVGISFNDNDTEPPSAVKMSGRDRQSSRWEMLAEAAAYLLETKWLQPVPLRVTRQRVGGKLMDVVETRLRDAESGMDERMDFVVEPESLLVHRVVRYYKGKPLSFYCFADYAAVDGIQMPRRTGDIDYQLWDKECRYPYPLKTQFNVDHDPRLFERAPSAEAGAEAWKPR